MTHPPPTKYPQNRHTPKNIYFFENPQKHEIQYFEPKIMTGPTYVCNLSEYPPPPWAGTPPWKITKIKGFLAILVRIPEK